MLSDAERKERRRESSRRYRERHPERVAASRKAWKDKNPGFHKEYRERNLDRLRAYDRERWPSRKGMGRLAHTSRRKGMHIYTCPGDTEAVNAFYLNCPDGLVVDHIIPYKGKNVCGLHVSWNLQYLEPAVNQAKKNNYIQSDALALSY